MDTAVFHHFNDIPTKEIAPGFFSKLIHTAANTINFIEVKAGCTVPLHSHLHEQCAFVMDGEFELTVNGTAQILKPGRYAIIPSNMPHSGLALTDCRLIDIFSPAREDYKLL